MTKQAAILVGGRGSRLGSLAANAPKPLMHISGDFVFLDYLLFNVARQGFNDILLLAGHMGDQVLSRYNAKSIYGAKTRVIIEPDIAGTGGALLHVSDLLQETFLLANGDTLFDCNFRSLDVILGENQGIDAVLALRRVPDASRFGRVKLDGRQVVAFEEKSLCVDGKSGLINAGAGMYRRSVLKYIDKVPSSIELDVYPKLVKQNGLAGEEFSGYFIDIGIPDTLAQARLDLPRRHLRSALFLDRDGVLNVDKGYTHRVEDLRWVDGAKETIRYANELGVLVMVVTNQSGIGRGFYDFDAVERFHSAMQRDLAQSGAFIDAFYVCPYHPDAVIDKWRHPEHPNRKPNPGMIKQALAEWPIDLAHTALIGDREADLEAARRVGMQHALFVGGDLRNVAYPILEALG